MRKRYVLAIAFVFLFVAVACAETSVKAELDKASITTSETLTYKVTIISSEKNLPPLRIPQFTGFNVVSQVQSSSVSFVRSGMKTILVYAFILAPVEAGKFKIEAVSLELKNKTYFTEAFEIEVKQGKSKPKTGPEEGPSLPEETLPESERPQITL